MASQPTAPIGPVPIIQAATALHLDMPDQCGRGVAGQPGPVTRGERPVTLVPPPVAPRYPPPRPGRVSSEGPTAQLLVGEVVQLGEARLGGTRPIVLRPTPNDRGEMADQHRLGAGAVLLHDRANRGEVATLG